MRELKIVSFLVVREDVLKNGQLLVSYAHFRVSLAPETDNRMEGDISDPS